MTNNTITIKVTPEQNEDIKQFLLEHKGLSKKAILQKLSSNRDLYQRYKLLALALVPKDAFNGGRWVELSKEDGLPQEWAELIQEDENNFGE